MRAWLFFALAALVLAGGFVHQERTICAAAERRLPASTGAAHEQFEKLVRLCHWE